MRAHSLCLSVADYVLAMGLAALIGGCAGSDDSSGLSPDYGDAPIVFTTDMNDTWEPADNMTRAYTGNIDDVDALKASGVGFGVFAYFTDTEKWDEAKGAYPVNDANYPTPDFMNNQTVEWGVQYMENEVPHNDWVYDPLKYWPNYSDNNPAEARYVSFFAYAPYTSEAEAAMAEATGVTGLPIYTDGKSTDDKSPHVLFTLGDVGSQTDLLWACKTDATRNGEGLIADVNPNSYQKVQLSFRHALSRVDIYVQRIFDEEPFSGKKPAGTEYTRLFISKVELAADFLEGTGSSAASLTDEELLALLQ